MQRALVDRYYGKLCGSNCSSFHKLLHNHVLHSQPLCGVERLRGEKKSGKTCLHSTEGSWILHQPRLPSVRTGKETLPAEMRTVFCLQQHVGCRSWCIYIVWMNRQQKGSPVFDQGRVLVCNELTCLTWPHIKKSAKVELLAEQKKKQQLQSGNLSHTRNGNYSSTNPLHTQSPCQTGNIQVRINDNEMLYPDFRWD